MISPDPTFTVGSTSPAVIALTVTNTFAEPTGAISVTKALVGTAAGDVPASSTFAVDYAYPVDSTTVTGTLVLTAGGTEILPDLPQGTVVTLQEREPAGVEGVGWGTATFSGEGVTTTDGVTTVTVGATTEFVTLTNTAERTP